MLDSPARGLCFLLSVTANIMLNANGSLAGSLANDGHSNKPNIILINLDDADAELMIGPTFEGRYRHMGKLAQRGIQFSNMHATTPLCGPSRACLLRGQYAHNTRVLVNQPDARIGNGMTGGMKFYRDQGYFDNDLSKWMKQAGYRTMMVGKFLHADFLPIVPPNWDDFYSYQGARYYDYYRFTNRAPGGKWDLSPPDLYRTVGETQDVLHLLQTHVDRENDQPFFLFLNPLGPHRPNGNRGMVDVAKYSNLWRHARLPFRASFNELDFSDKRGDIGTIGRLTGYSLDYIQSEYRDRLLATLSIDDQVGAIVDKLDELDLTENTYIFVTSDNGFSLGYNRVLGKGFHYDLSTRVPLFVAGPNIKPGGMANHLMANIDISPTLVELAGGQVPGFVDGKSFVDLLKNPDSVRAEDWRSTILIENWESRFLFGQELFCANNSVRRFNSIYTEHANGEREYFNLARDPQQLFNSYDRLSAASRMVMALQLRALKNPEVAPTIGFTVPSENGKQFLGGLQLSGLVDDPLGVGAVRLAIQNKADQKYWNGEAWVDGFHQVSASIDAPGSTISHWRYKFEPKPEDIPIGSIRVWAWGFDTSGRWGKAAYRVFLTKFGGPRSTIRLPRPQSVIMGDVKFDGTAFASNGASSIRFVLRHADDGKYWNGTQFQPNWKFVTVPVDGVGQWKHRLKLPVGRYHVATYGVDREGVVESKPNVAFFVVE